MDTQNKINEVEDDHIPVTMEDFIISMRKLCESTAIEYFLLKNENGGSPLMINMTHMNRFQVSRLVNNVICETCNIVFDYNMENVYVTWKEVSDKGILIIKKEIKDNDFYSLEDAPGMLLSSIEIEALANIITQVKDMQIPTATIEEE